MDFLAFHGTRAASDFPDSWQLEIGLDAKAAEDFLVALEHVAEAGQISGSGFGKNHAAGAATGAVANVICFEEEDGFFLERVAWRWRRQQVR